MKKNKKPAAKLAAVVLVAALSSSCFTAAVWSPDVQGPRYGVTERLALTPFALALDLLTWPIQRAIWDPHYDHSPRQRYDCD